MTMVDRAFDEPALMGSRSYGVGLADWTCVAPDHWAFEGTGMNAVMKLTSSSGGNSMGLPLAKVDDRVRKITKNILDRMIAVEIKMQLPIDQAKKKHE